MINPTNRDIDRRVILVKPGVYNGAHRDSGRIASSDERYVYVLFGDEAVVTAFAREELVWASGRDRE